MPQSSERLSTNALRTNIDNNKSIKNEYYRSVWTPLLESLKYNSKAEKAVTSRNPTTRWLNNLFLFFFLYLFLYFCVYRKQALLSYLHNDSNLCYWLAWIYKKYIFLILETKSNNSCLYLQISLKCLWCLLKNLRITLFIFSVETPYLLIPVFSGLFMWRMSQGCFLL